MATNVLLVDDSALVRKQLKDAFSVFDLDIVEAEDGAKALAIMRTGKIFSVLICDVNMPNMDGVDLCENIFKEKLSPEMFILMLTTEASPELKEKVKNFGVKAWITKPFNPKVLQNVMQKVLDLNKTVK